MYEYGDFRQLCDLIHDFAEISESVMLEDGTVRIKATTQENLQVLVEGKVNVAS